MPQKKQTDDEQYKELLADMEALKDLPNGKGDNMTLDDEDERILAELYPSADD